MAAGPRSGGGGQRRSGQLLHRNASALEMELAVPRFVFTAPGSSLPRTTDCFGPPRLSDSSESGGGPSTSRLSPEAIASGIRELYRRNILRLFSNNFGDFTWSKFSDHNPRSPVLNEQKRFSPNGSAFARRHHPRRV